MNNRTNVLGRFAIKAILLIIISHSCSLLYSQSGEWEIDKIRKREQEEKVELDSTLVHLKNNWQVSLSYGQFYFNKSSRSEVRPVIDIPRNMGSWNLSFGRYFAESLMLNVNLGITLKTVKPPQPDVFSILSGAEVEIEGGGIVLLPLSIGLDYLFLKKRFRPYAGFNAGMVSATYRLIEASGDVNRGINSREYSFNSKSGFIELSSGFVYRTGKSVQLGLNCDFVQSSDFSENIGGYTAYNGFKVSVVFAVVF